MPDLAYDRSKAAPPMCRVEGCGELVERAGQKMYCAEHAGTVTADLPRVGTKHPKRGRPPRTEDRYVDSAGYAHVRIEGRFYPEHRIVMMAMLGRPMFPGESVHHRNGQRSDNKPSNLELWVGPIRRGARGTDLRCFHCGEKWIPRAPKAPKMSLAEVTERMVFDGWPVHSSEAPPGFFERFRKSAEVVSASRGARRVSDSQAALWDGTP